MNKICSLDCKKKYYAKGFCEMHYHRFKRHGDPNIVLKPVVRHGLTHLPEYGVWQAMKGRCLDPKQAYYKDYGGRGIKVCDRWLHSFLSFLEDMEKRPSPQHALDRWPDMNGNYEPGNCRWATLSQQNINRRKLKSNTSGYVGVSLHKKVGKWRAYVSVGYKVYFFGLFTTPEEAAYVRDQVAIQLYDKDAVLNVIM